MRAIETEPGGDIDQIAAVVIFVIASVGPSIFGIGNLFHGHFILAFVDNCFHVSPLPVATRESDGSVTSHNSARNNWECHCGISRLSETRATGVNTSGRSFTDERRQRRVLQEGRFDEAGHVGKPSVARFYFRE